MSHYTSNSLKHCMLTVYLLFQNNIFITFCHVCMPQRLYGSQRITYGSQFFHSIRWLLGMKQVISLDSKTLYPQMHVPASYDIYWLPHFLLCFT